jgi:phage gpG-like protein
MANRTVDVEVHGVREFQRGARRLAQNIDDRADTAFKSVADQTATMVRSRVPRRTGRLAASLSGDHADHGATVGYDLIYAGPVDYGGWPPGRPYVAEGRYLYPTALEARDLLKRAGEAAAEHEIRSMLWPKPTAL